MKRLPLLIVLLAGTASLLALVSCAEQQSAGDVAIKSASYAHEEVATTNKQVPNRKTIYLTYDDGAFPAGAGRKQFMASCTICHSLRYISMQPNFPRKTWEKTVDKMRKTFGAPVTDAQAKEIIDYLVAIKGTEAGSEKAGGK